MNNDRNELFTTAPIPKAVATLAVPTVLSMLVTVIYNMADTFFVGQTNDPNQVAAVSITMPIFLILMAFGNIFGIGGSSMISRLMGEGNIRRIKQVSSFCFYGGIIAGLILTVLFLVAMPGILGLIGSSPNTVDFARDYLTYIAIGAVFVVLSSAFGNIVRGEGAAKTSMIGMMLGTIVNIVLDPIMILGMNMGVSGAAIATIIGNICSVIFYIHYLTSKKSNTLLSIKPSDFKPNTNIIFGVFAIGIPASLNNILMSVANVVLNNFLGTYGDIPLAAMGVALKANMLVVFLQMGLAMGIQPLIGFCYGSGRFKRLKQTMGFAMCCTLIIGSVLTGIYYIFTQQIISVFIRDDAVIQAGIGMLRALMVSGPFLGLLFTFTFSFQAMGRAIPSLILSISRQGLIFLPVIVLSNMFFGLEGLIYSQPIADLVSLCLAFIIFLILNKSMKAHEAAYAQVHQESN